MPLDPRVRRVVALANRQPDDPDMTMADRRARSARTARALGRIGIRRGPEVDATSHVVVPVEGGRIRVRTYRPAGPARQPLHVFLHGGGWCQGTLDERDDRCRAIAVGAQCVVASVDYRLAPENAFPTPLEDCYAALCHLVEHAEELGIDPGRVSIGGESAGANLAAVVAILARDRSGPALRFQALDVPATDLTRTQPSVERFGVGYVLTRADMDRYVEAYLLPGTDERDPLASPLFAPDLSGLPPALVMTAEYDPLHDEGEAYARRLVEAGVPVERHDLAGHVHASFALTRLVPSSAAYEAVHVAAIGRALHEG